MSAMRDSHAEMNSFQGKWSWSQSIRSFLFHGFLCHSPIPFIQVVSMILFMERMKTKKIGGQTHPTHHHLLHKCHLGQKVGRTIDLPQITNSNTLYQQQRLSSGRFKRLNQLIEQLPRAMADANRIHPTERVVEVLPMVPKQPPAQLRRNSCCCRCICATVSLLVFLLIVVGAMAGILYLVFKPKIPHYTIDSLQISDLKLNLDMSLYARFDVKVTATNPNEHIGIHYEKGGQISVWFQKDMLCAGKLPTFYQGHRNVTKLHMVLTGEHESGSTILTALQQQQQSGGIPLNLKVSAPVAVQLGGFKTMKVRVLGDCSLVVDSLSANSLVSIQSNSCRFGLKL